MQPLLSSTILSTFNALDDSSVEVQVPDLVHDDGDPAALQAVLEHVLDERRLPAAEEACDDVDGDGLHAASTCGRPSMVGGVSTPSIPRIVGAMSTIRTSPGATDRPRT